MQKIARFLMSEWHYIHIKQIEQIYSVQLFQKIRFGPWLRILRQLHMFCTFV